jgi:glucose-6-phosphate isomerase
MMAYHERLTTFVDWYRQLWAESLGKGGKGQTPVKAVGAVDQHSQIQLYNEGPKDKIITFLRVESFSSDIEIPSLYPDKPALAYLGGHSLGELMNKELVGTASALAKRGVPSVTISMPQVDELNLGALFMVYEMATALTGHLYGINPFDQPGVEEGKRLTYGLMGRPGFEDKGKEAREIWEKNEKAVFALSLEE